MNSALEQLRDIRGLDPAPGWPASLSGWVLVAGVLLALAAVVWFYQQRRCARVRWRKEMVFGCRRLRARLGQVSAHEAAGELCELLRRIGMAYGGRRACAGLVGEGWLAWLESHDPERFPWRREGRRLLALAYAPPRHEPPLATELAPLVNAAEVWLHKPPTDV